MQTDHQQIMPGPQATKVKFLNATTGKQTYTNKHIGEGPQRHMDRYLEQNALKQTLGNVYGEFKSLLTYMISIQLPFKECSLKLQNNQQLH